MSEEVKKASEINLKVGMDENNVPLEILWTAENQGKDSPAKAMMLALWDEQEKNTMRIDLWTKEMRVDEMKQFFHQSMLTMADTFERSTNETKMANEIRSFSRYFADKMGLMLPE